MPEKLFLSLLKAAIGGEACADEIFATEEQWQEVFRLAEIHKVLPLIFDKASSLYPYNHENLLELKQKAMLMTTKQALKTLSFLELYKELSQKGLEPLTVKGIICRSVYPKPDLRISADEDMLINPVQAELYEKELTNAGMLKISNAKADAQQIGYINSKGLYIEVHNSLFPKDKGYFDRYNKIFENALETAEYTEIEGVKIRTLPPTLHLLYLILHAAKHFLHSGVGIRQVSDIIMYANACKDSIDWDFLYEKCENLSLLKFTAAIFSIGRDHLNFCESKAFYPKKWREIKADPAPLLEDILSAGVYGGSSRARLHSAGITIARTQGKKKNVLSNIFPSAQMMKNKYPYVKKHPVLLPVAWAQRIIKYRKEMDKESDNTPQGSLKIANERLKLIDSYGLFSNK